MRRPKTHRPSGLLGGLPLVVVGALCLLVGTAFADGPVTMELTLDEAQTLAVDHNRELAIARASEDAARARLTQARAGFFPKIGASGSYTRLNEIPYMDGSAFGAMFEPLMAPFDYLVSEGYLDPSTLEGLSGAGGSDRIYMGDDDIYSIGLTVQQPLFTGGAIVSAHGAASHASRAEALNRQRTEDQVRYDVANAYFGLLQARAALEVTLDLERQMASHLSDVEAMHEEGMVLAVDLMQARVAMSEVELARSRAEHGVRLAGSALSFVIGIDIGTAIEPVDSLERGDIRELGLDEWTERALADRPDLSAAGEYVRAADNAVGIARSGYWPSLVLIGNYNWDRPNQRYEPEFYDSWSVTLAAQMNILDWGATSGKVREARAGLAQVEEGRELMAEAVRLEVKQGYLTLGEARDALDIAERGLTQARESMDLARESFRNGAATSSAVLDAEAALTRSEMNRIAAVTGLRLAEAAMTLAAGGTH